ncbi:hypothetical protein AMD24_00238 [Candidatus Xiphinematobacter sp. Idaho Grape]|uniref:hypothetical protein n=1 Tax=Candidatus Xiphinematobacter sp. Idaho Grape TaxID=1704307 RepID=UPI000705C578|nr:hypothetical protein [Candidatus Xiphinematobacter sp. Idaho Grape]ALJ56426.1 hypothetical protein AMD24_00238 [Candidatus Xiphinematobacter sp. Idaho Grape]
MNIESFTPATVRALVSLAEKRKKLLEQVQSLEAEIASLLDKLPPGITAGKGGRPLKNSTRSARTKRGDGKGQKPGVLKKRILEMLRLAGATGVTVSEIAKELSIRPANVHVWFSTTGKRLEEVAKVAPGRFCYHATTSKKG